MNQEFDLLLKVKEKYLLNLQKELSIDKTNYNSFKKTTNINFSMELKNKTIRLIVEVEYLLDGDSDYLDEASGSTLVDCLEKLLKH